MEPHMISESQKQQYEKDGFLVLRSVFNEEELAALDRAAEAHPPLDDGKPVGTYPGPGRYTLAKSSWVDPAFVHFAEHPTILAGARYLLDDDIRLTAYVMYDRTPGGKGLPAHHDYKRWRPVGSGMHWLFTIVPMCDYDDQTGQLFVAPGSHHLERISDKGDGAMHVDPAVFPTSDDFIDPELKRGDLLFMNMHLWHKAADNISGEHRLGLFNKYGSVHHPPATGYFVFSEEVHDLFSEEGRQLLAVHSDKPVATARLLLQRERNGQQEFFFLNDDNSLSLPGGEVHFEDAIPDWDIGNYIESVQFHVRKQVRIEVPWMSYVGDYEEEDHLCRVYAYPMKNHGFPVPYDEGSWLSVEAMAEAGFRFGYETTAVDDWSDPTLVRGKGLSQAKSRVDQFAY